MNAIFSGPTPLAFVTGATGLLGNNLVREVLAQGFRVRALARSPDKAERQFAGLPVEIVTGDMLAVDAFAPALAGVDVVFHTAAYFRDSYTGGRRIEQLVSRLISVGFLHQELSAIDARVPLLIPSRLMLALSALGTVGKGLRDGLDAKDS